MALQPEPPITDAEVDAELATLRKSIPKCAAYHCETEAGWEKFVADQGFTMEELRDRWRQRMEVLRFIEERFRMGIRIEPSEIDDYYKKTMLPVYQKEKRGAAAGGDDRGPHPGDSAAAAGGEAAGRLADGAARAGQRDDVEAGRGGAMSGRERAGRRRAGEAPAGAGSAAPREEAQPVFHISRAWRG